MPSPRHMGMRHPRTVIWAAPVLASLVILLSPSAAEASCAMPPVESPHAFTGTVLEVEQDGRVATVELDDGREVVVNGSPEAGSTVTSVDRRFEPGARYVFHPLNATSPYEDNACTATRRLAGTGTSTGSGSGSGSGSDDRILAWLPVDGQAGPSGYAAVAAVAVAAVVALGLLVTLARSALLRRGRRGTAQGQAVKND